MTTPSFVHLTGHPSPNSTSPATFGGIGTAPEAEALAANNNSCQGEGNSRACGAGPRSVRADGTGAHLLLTESVSIGVAFLSGEVGVMWKIDPNTLESEAFVYGGIGPGQKWLDDPANANATLEQVLAQAAEFAKRFGFTWPQ